MSFKKSLLATAVLMSAANVGASGYKINEQSVSGAGNSHAGRAALVEDASVVFYNPAGMTKLERPELSVGVTYIDVRGDFDGEYTSVSGTPGAAEGYDDDGDFIPNPVIPFIYYARPVSEKVAVGLGLFVPFGTHTDYSTGDSAIGFADETQLTSIDIQPTIAYQLTDTFSIGGGLDIVYMKGLLSSGTDLVPFVPSPLAPAALQNPENAGFENTVEIEGDDWSLGFNLGLMWDITPATTFGMAYRSEIEFKLEGEAEFTQSENIQFYSEAQNAILPIQVLGQLNPNITDFDSEDAHVPITTPQSLTFSLAHQLNDRLTLQTGATWTDWSTFQELDIIGSDNGVISTVSNQGENSISHILEDWRDTWAFALGASYQLNNSVLLRAGYAFDESPLSDTHRTARVPDGDRQWLTAGARFVATNNLSFDVAFGYLLFDKVRINEINNNLDNEPTGDAENLRGQYDIDAYSVGVQMNYRL